MSSTMTDWILLLIVDTDLSEASFAAIRFVGKYNKMMEGRVVLFHMLRDGIRTKSHRIYCFHGLGVIFAGTSKSRSMNNMPSPPRRYLWALVPLVPLAGYLIYRSLTPEQKKKFKDSLSKGAFGMISATFTQLADAYRNNQTIVVPGTTVKNGVAAVPKMVAMPSADESETTGGDERW